MIDLKQYLGTKTAIHCKTQEEANAMDYLLREISGEYINFKERWKEYSENDKMCYSLDGSICYSRRRFYEEEKYTIIEASDILVPELDNYSIF